MSKFKIGDRVVCFGQPHGVGFVLPSIEGDSGQVIGFSKSGHVQVKLSSDPYAPYLLYHPKQCRKLVKKERRRVWIQDHVSPKDFVHSDLVPGRIFSNEARDGFTEFAEVRKKKKE